MLVEPPESPEFIMTVNANLRQLEPLAEESPTRIKRTEYDEFSGEVHRQTFEAYYKHTSRLQREAYPSDDRVQTSLFDSKPAEIES